MPPGAGSQVHCCAVGLLNLCIWGKEAGRTARQYSIVNSLQIGCPLCSLESLSAFPHTTPHHNAQQQAHAAFCVNINKVGANREGGEKDLKSGGGGGMYSHKCALKNASACWQQHCNTPVSLAKLNHCMHASNRVSLLDVVKLACMQCSSLIRGRLWGNLPHSCLLQLQEECLNPPHNPTYTRNPHHPHVLHLTGLTVVSRICVLHGT